MSTSTSTSTSTPSPNVPAKSAATLDAEFFRGLELVLAQICTRFPENTEAATLKSRLGLVALRPSYMSVLRTEWRKFTDGASEDLQKRDPKFVLDLVESRASEEIKMIGVHKYLNDPEVDSATKDVLWGYLLTLTKLAHTQAGPSSPPVGTDTGAEAKKENNNAKKPAGLDIEKLAQTVVKTMPQLASTFNKMMEDDGGDNAFAQVVRSFMDPSRVQPGLAGNLTSVAMSQYKGPEPSVMEELQESVGVQLTAEEIAAKLRKLDKIERLQAKKRRSRH